MIVCYFYSDHLIFDLLMMEDSDCVLDERKRTCKYYIEAFNSHAHYKYLFLF